MTEKAFVGVLFNCCNVYSRAYQGRVGDYVGRCPRCARQVLLAGAATKPPANVNTRARSQRFSTGGDTAA
ncbi:MAG: hypothetical protein RJA70_924 [Pseudomonadota bacterium]|jgi:hypothetical protein